MVCIHNKIEGNQIMPLKKRTVKTDSSKRESIISREQLKESL